MSSTAAPVAGLILAAGRSARMGFPKALGRYAGESFVRRLVRLQGEAGCVSRCVVVSRPHGAAIESELSGTGAAVVVNPSPELGMLSSLQCGLRHVAGGAAAAALVGLVDQPLVVLSTMRALLAAQATSGADWVFPVHAGRRGHPYVIGRDLFPTALGLSESATARDLLAQARRPLGVEVDDRGVVLDLDYPGDLARVGAAPPVEPPR